jgi:ribosomal protein S15P/S13E
MKFLFFTVSLMMVFSIQSLSQMHDRPPQHMRDKVNQLEKIKLIEVLEMDEETTLRFFSRRSVHQTKVEELIEQTDGIITQMEDIFKEGKVYTEVELKSLIEEANSIHNQIVQSKSDFINSLDDILTTEQIAKLIIFERRFKNELKRAMFKGRNRKFQD